ncbi:cupin domain-containing protein [Reyranella sp.]|uniref:cupin domain-containing protein n=1 Tax=Reyranella sp. TaxID=1929291 RepID=UPI003D0AEC6F
MLALAPLRKDKDRLIVLMGNEDSKASHFIIAPDRRARPLNVVGTQVTVLASNDTTKSYGITLQQGDEGTGPPPHSHDWDEAFYVLKGAIRFHCAGEVHECAPGTLVHIPRGTVHEFHYGPGGGQMLEITGEKTLAAQMFAAVDAAIPSGPTDVSALLQVLAANGVSVAKPAT